MQGDDDGRGARYPVDVTESPGPGAQPAPAERRWLWRRCAGISRRRGLQEGLPPVFRAVLRAAELIRAAQEKGGGGGAGVCHLTVWPSIRSTLLALVVTRCVLKNDAFSCRTMGLSKAR